MEPRSNDAMEQYEWSGAAKGQKLDLKNVSLYYWMVRIFDYAKHDQQLLCETETLSLNLKLMEKKQEICIYI